MNTQLAREEKVGLNIANDSWNGLEELSRDSSSFQLKKKSKIADISAVSEAIEETANIDDAIHKENLIKDEQILKEYEEEKSRKESILNLKKSKNDQSSNESKKQIVLEKKSINENSTKTIVNDYHDSQKVNDISTMENALGVSKVEVTNNKGVTGVISPSDNSQTIGSVAPNIQKKEGVKEEFNTNKVKTQKEAGLLKSMGRGFAYLYVNKTSNMLNPVRFFMEHYKKLFMAIIQLGVPAIITWYITTQIAFISHQIHETGAIMSVVYTSVFYVATLFIWCSSLFVLSLIGGMLKREAMEVAKIGEKNT